MEQPNGVQRPIDRLQSALAAHVEHTTGQHPLERRLSWSVHSSHPTAGARLGAQLHRRLEEVDVQPHGSVQLGQLAIGALAFEAVVADQLPHDRTVLLLDEALVVLVGHPATGEGELFVGTVGQQFLIDELAAVVGVDPEQGEGEHAARPLQRMDDAMLGAMQQRQALGPGRGHVGQGERAQEGTLRTATAVGDQVSLDEAWLDVGPLGEGTDRDLLFEQPSRLGGRQPMRLTQRPQQPIGRGWAERQQLLTGLVGEAQVTVVLERRDQLGQEWHQALGADPVSC